MLYLKISCSIFVKDFAGKGGVYSNGSGISPRKNPRPYPRPDEIPEGHAGRAGRENWLFGKFAEPLHQRQNGQAG